MVEKICPKCNNKLEKLTEFKEEFDFKESLMNSIILRGAYAPAYNKIIFYKCKKCDYKKEEKSKYKSKTFFN